MKILLGQSDPEDLDLTAYALNRHGFRALTALDGKTAIAKWEREKPDLIVLETSLAKVNGLEVCRQIRGESQVPVVFLSEKSGDQDIIAAFNAGGDDYIVKPFSLRQLIVRVEAALRRVALSRLRADGIGELLTIGNLQIDSSEHRVVAGDKRVHLTPIEFRLLYYLAVNKGRVISIDQLIDYAWGAKDGGDSGVLKTHISHLRQKLEKAGPVSGAIRNVSGVGYCLDE